MENKRTQEIISSVKKIMSSPINEMAMNEMAQISGALKDAIEAVIAANSDKSGLELKKAIKADEAVKAALGEDELYDNQLNRFISLAKGERELGTRGRKTDSKKSIGKSVLDKFNSGDEYTAEEIDFIKQLAKSAKKPAAKKAEEGPMEEQLNESLIRMQKLAGVIKG